MRASQKAGSERESVAITSTKRSNHDPLYLAVWACFDKTDREKGDYWLVVFEFKLSG